MDSYDFHGLETMQCMVERRAGGETRREVAAGLSRRQVLGGLPRRHLAARSLLEAALCRSHTLTPARAGFNDIFPTLDDMQRLVKDPVAYRYEHNDGLKCTMLLMNGLVQDFNFAALHRRHVRAVLHPDVSADAGRPHHAGQLLQPAGQQHGEDVPDRQGDLPDGAHAADHGT